MVLKTVVADRECRSRAKLRGGFKLEVLFSQVADSQNVVPCDRERGHMTRGHLQKLAPTQWLTPTICSVSFGGSGDLIRVLQLLPSASSLRVTPAIEAGVGPCSRKIGAVGVTFLSHDQTSEVLQPGKKPLDFPAAVGIASADVYPGSGSFDSDDVGAMSSMP
jgi:hypothetical protein